MNIILLEKINKLGALGDQVSVKAGFGRNYLIPHGKALPATKANVKMFEERRAELEADAAKSLTAATARAETLNGKEVVIVRKAGDEGRMFGSVTNSDVAEALNAAGAQVEKREVRMPEGAIRELGEYDINLHLHTDVNATVKILVEAE
ncbi:MAG: 50S ribosomal protein L9 [gamma proteobacterium symbiont of Taylorina sp.]|nr:50S ribosomal protein L9 [gamma proteobacterium symbiont of Taylorina sp.]